MTRFFKVSLSVVALLLVSLLVFTGCNSETADQALAAAEEAKQAVVTATTDLEKAIATKADATKLAEEVDKLTKAIQSAEAVAEDGDSALLAAIKTAKAAVTEHAETIVNALDVKIAGLMAEKADKATVDAELARLSATIESINEATGAYIKLNDFVSFSSQAAMHAYELEQKFYRMAEFEYLYGDDWANIEKAYAIAKVVIYRATSMEVINSALEQFDLAVMDNANDIDVLYYDYVLGYENGSIAKAETVYDAVSSLYMTALATETEKDEELITDYYGKGNLVLIALENWRAELSADMTAIGKLYVVNPENEDYTDADYIAETEAGVSAFAVAAESCNGWFENVESLKVPKAYTNNVARNAIMVNAKADAEAVIALGTEFATAYPDGVVLEQACVDAVAAWKAAYDGWVRTYLPELQKHEKDNEELVARYDAVAALIAPTEESLNAAVAALEEKATAYVDAANEAFINDLKAAFYDAKTATVLDLDRVTVMSGADITALKEKADKWAEDNSATLVLPSFVYADNHVVRPNEAYANIAVIAEDFAAKTAEFAALYAALPHAEAEALLEAGKLGIYDEAPAAILAAVADIEWGEATEIVLSEDLKVEKEYIDNLAALEATRYELIEYVLGKKVALEEAFAAVAELTTVEAIEEALDAIEPMFNAFSTGEHTDLPEGVTADMVAYVHEHSANKGKLPDGTEFDLNLDMEGLGKIIIDAQVYALTSDALIKLNSLKTNDEAPYFDDDEETEVTDSETYEIAVLELEIYLEIYQEYFGEDADEDFVTEIEKAIIFAQLKLEAEAE